MFAKFSYLALDLILLLFSDACLHNDALHLAYIYILIAGEKFIRVTATITTCAFFTIAMLNFHIDK